ncbi:hypothetical protein SAMN05421881_11294, partial [Nitrosomonas halophila]
SFLWSVLIVSGVVSDMAIPRSFALRLREQSRVPFLGGGCVVPPPQAVLWTPPTSIQGRAAFVSLYSSVGGLSTSLDGSPALGNKSSRTCRPCYPGSRWPLLPLFRQPSNGLPLSSTGSASPLRLRGYSWVHLRYGLLSCCVETHDPALPRRRFLMLPGRTDNSPDGTSTR